MKHYSCSLVQDALNSLHHLSSTKRGVYDK
nr:MAG TPA: hypothetical protein [Caudoviricetes sp.]